MNENTIYIPNPTKALSFAARELPQLGCTLVSSASDARAVLLPIPTPANMDPKLYGDRCIIGGHLDTTVKNAIDLLCDPDYLAQNAAITAEAALGLILPQLTDSLNASPILILGWGRIGKCLAKKLQQLGVPVSVYARKGSDQAMLLALHYKLYHPNDLPKYRCIVNTATAPILTEDNISYVNPSCYLLDLASAKFIPGETVVHGRGLPGKCKPEASGKLIAHTVAQYLQGGK